MKQAYAPALEVQRDTQIEKIRELPLAGEALVGVGDTVCEDDVVLRAALPGDLTVVRIADRLGFDPEDVLPHCRFAEGDKLQAGQLLCEMSTFFGLFTSRIEAPVSGVVEFFTERNAHLGIRQEAKPVSVNAYISGEVTAVEGGKRVTIRTRGSLIQGVFGVGGERRGEILCLPCAADALVQESDLRSLSFSLEQKILIGGSSFSLGALRYAAEQGVAAVVTGSIDAGVLSEYVGRDIGVSITGDEAVGSTLIITEGFGALPISERVLELARFLEGKQASVNGATQVRAGATRPEVIVSTGAVLNTDFRPEVKQLELGAPIRIIRVPYFGCFGTITALPHDLYTVESGAEVRVLHAQLKDGREVIVPRANVELL